MQAGLNDCGAAERSRRLLLLLGDAVRPLSLTRELTGPAPAARTLENECWCQRSDYWSPFSAGSGVERIVRIGAIKQPSKSLAQRILSGI
jgi:hypothetical protein